LNCRFLFEINRSGLPEPEDGGFVRPVGKKIGLNLRAGVRFEASLLRVRRAHTLYTIGPGE
jgi:hypothetical protein